MNEFLKQCSESLDKIRQSANEKNWLKYELLEIALLEDKEKFYHITDRLNEFKDRSARVIIKFSLDTYNSKIEH